MNLKNIKRYFIAMFFIFSVNTILAKRFIKKSDYRYAAANVVENLHNQKKSNNTVVEDGRNIIVDKKNVRHAFVPFDEKTDHFVKNIFANWENDTFEIFDQVKDPFGLAIDLGAWIGTTAIWLSKNFDQVLTVDADQVSLQCLKNNLQASNCSNVIICEQPVTDVGETIIFGPRGNNLNESISYVKKESNNSNDYSVKGITFKQLIHDYIYANNSLKNKKISFIKCDIEGGEESILEDILYFANYNNVKVYMSFHYDWWKNKNIDDYKNIFKFFKTNCPTNDIVNYIKKHPFASILFDPLPQQESLLKKNMPVVIIGYNQVSYIRNMVSQLEKYTNDIIIVDNNSDFQPLLDYYANEFKYTLLRQNINHGHRVFQKYFVQKLVGDFYCITDPDLQFNDKLPDNFIQILLEISRYFNAEKVGFALFIDSDNFREDLIDKKSRPCIKEQESKYWRKKLDYSLRSDLILYAADVDTTFCLINKKGVHPRRIRVAGDFICLHLPWFKNFKDFLIPGEYEAYLKNNISTTCFQ